MPGIKPTDRRAMLCGREGIVYSGPADNLLMAVLAVVVKVLQRTQNIGFMPLCMI